MKVNTLPGGSVQLEREDDVIGMAHLAHKASLGAKVTVEHVVGGKLDQSHQVGGVLAFSYLDRGRETRGTSDCQRDNSESTTRSPTPVVTRPTCRRSATLYR